MQGNRNEEKEKEKQEDMWRQSQDLEGSPSDCRVGQAQALSGQIPASGKRAGRSLNATASASKASSPRIKKPARNGRDFFLS